MSYQDFVTWLYSSNYGLFFLLFIPILILFLLSYFYNKQKANQTPIEQINEEEYYLKSKKPINRKIP